MLYEDLEPTICFNCDAEFVVQVPYDTRTQINFCPFCGSETDETDDDDFDEEDM